VRYLIEAGADVHANDDCALHRAAQNGHFEAVLRFGGFGLDDALMWAIANEHTMMVRWLSAFY
jgi:ankyrin repeat protein